MLGPVGTARRVDGGYRVSGRYQFGSGCAHASFIGAGTIEVDDDGTALTTESGLPAMRVVLIPRAEIDFRGNWDVLGLTATGSYDYVVDDVFVPESYTYSLLENVQQRGGPAFRIGLFSITASGHAGFALGVGRRALDEITTLASTRVRMAGFATIGTEQLFQYELAQHDCALRAARALVYEAIAEADAEARAQDGAGTDPPAARAGRGHLRDARRHRRGALRLPLGRVRRAPTGDRPALPARPARRQPAHLRRQQHPHRVRRRTRRRPRRLTPRRPVAGRISRSPTGPEPGREPGERVEHHVGARGAELVAPRPARWPRRRPAPGRDGAASMSGTVSPT